MTAYPVEQRAGRYRNGHGSDHVSATQVQHLGVFRTKEIQNGRGCQVIVNGPYQGKVVQDLISSGSVDPQTEIEVVRDSRGTVYS